MIKKYENLLKQIAGKKAKSEKFKKHNLPKERKFGKGLHVCRRCGRRGTGIIRKYELNYCRQCMREVARKLGFEKYN